MPTNLQAKRLVLRAGQRYGMLALTLLPGRSGRTVPAMELRFSRFEIVTGTGGLFLCLAFVCVFIEATAIQANVGSAAARAVAHEELFWLAVEPQGQHVVLTGAAADEEAGARAARSASAVAGVSRVTNRIRALGSDGGCQRRLDVHLEQQPVGFRSGRVELTELSYPALQTVAGILRDCRARFEIAAHTASGGDTKVNLQLSQRRAETAMRHLVEQGVDPDRLTAVGYGSRQRGPSRNGVEAAGERLEFRILGDGA
jgi:outer membrane protein OmpA-like peptidoglycan-associated protein